MTRAKFRVQSKTEYHGTGDTVAVQFMAVTSGSPENELFWKYTPSGEIKMQIKKEVADLFEIGKEYYVDFTPAVVETANT
jgi:hypothetical protein